MNVGDVYKISNQVIIPQSSWNIITTPDNSTSPLSALPTTETYLCMYMVMTKQID